MAEHADLLLSDGHIHGAASARSIAIKDGKILWMGLPAQEARFRGPETRVIELGKRSLSAGLVDGHAHLYGLGAAASAVALRGCPSEQACADIVAAVAAKRPKGEWITGRNWDHTTWASNRLPVHSTLDAKIPDHPVAVRRVDGHAVWLNAVALQRAGITRETKDPPGGRIVRDAKGEPTGVLVDNALGLVNKHIPAASKAMIRRRIIAGAAEAVRLGLTGVHEMGVGERVIEVYRELAAEGKLPLRVYAFYSGSAQTYRNLSQMKPEPAGDGTNFSMRGVKFYMDGALGSRGARLLAPYSDAPENSGLWIAKPAAMKTMIELAAKHGWQVAVHAIGDAANRAVLDIYRDIYTADPKADRRMRIEHAQVLAPEDLGRFAQYQVIASMQPTHATSDMRWAKARLGPVRVQGAYAWQKVLASGARLVAGSDFPVERPAPLEGIYAAVTRMDRSGKPAGGWHPAQRMSLAAALRAFTEMAAYASFTEGQRGLLRPGYAADITVYDRVLSADSTLLDTQIDFTIVGGRIVFERK